jgi:hypothetical protein
MGNIVEIPAIVRKKRVNIPEDERVCLIEPKKPNNI